MKSAGSSARSASPGGRCERRSEYSAACPWRKRGSTCVSGNCRYRCSERRSLMPYNPDCPACRDKRMHTESEWELYHPPKKTEEHSNVWLDEKECRAEGL